MISQLDSIFLALYEYNLILSLQLLVIFALRKPFRRKLGARHAYLLWLIPLACIPFYFLDGSGLVHMLSALFTNSQEQAATTTVLDALQAPALFDLSFVLPEFSDTALPVQTFSLGALVALLWITGIALIVLRFCLARFRLNHLLRQARPVQTFSTVGSNLVDAGFHPDTPVLTLNALTSPALAGVFNPVLLLPEGFTERFGNDERRLMLRHEFAHLSRKDNAWNLVAYLFKGVFWLNPLVHLAYRLFRQDQEISCDAIALAHCNDRERNRYALILAATLNTSGPFHEQPLVSTWGAFHNIKERAIMIQNHKKPTLPRLVAMGLLLLLAIFIATFTTTLSVTAQQQSDAPVAGPVNTLSREAGSLFENIQSERGAGNYAEAVALLDQLYGMYEQGDLNSFASYLMFIFYGYTAIEQGQYEKAVDYFDQALASPSLTEPQLRQAYQTKGQLAMQLGDYQLAVDSFLLAIQYSEAPEYPLLQRLIYAYYSLEDYQQALNYAEQLLDTHYDEAKHYDYQRISDLYRSAGNDTRADELDREAEQRLQEETGFASPTNGGPMPALGSDGKSYTPLVVVPPTYPDSALGEKIEGWVRVGFTVSPEGKVLNPVVLEAEPEGIFDQSALNSISRFKFKEMENEVSDLQYVFTFKLED